MKIPNINMLVEMSKVDFFNKVGSKQNVEMVPVVNVFPQEVVNKMDYVTIIYDCKNKYYSVFVGEEFKYSITDASDEMLVSVMTHNIKIKNCKV